MKNSNLEEINNYRENGVNISDREQNRKDWHEKARHVLAFVIILSITIYFFLHMYLYKGYEIPDIFKYYVGFGSTVVAYYFFKER